MPQDLITATMSRMEGYVEKRELSTGGGSVKPGFRVLAVEFFMRAKQREIGHHFRS
jgi:hypothetical protein